MERDIVHPEVEAYLARLAPRPDDVRAKMERLAADLEFPIVGPLCGPLLELLARAVGARRVFELGSGFGYSTLFFARAVGEGGTVVHTDLSPTRSEQARALLARAQLGQRVDFVVGDALEALAARPGPFDLVFCDVDKEAYPRVPDLAVPRLRQGGLLVFDNALWSGRVADGDVDETTAAVKRLNADLAARKDLLTSIIPLRDGLSVSVKL